MIPVLTIYSSLSTVVGDEKQIYFTRKRFCFLFLTFEFEKRTEELLKIIDSVGFWGKMEVVYYE